MLLSLTIPYTRQRDVLLQVTVLADGVQGLQKKPVAHRINVCRATEFSKTLNVEDIHPVVLSYNHYLNRQSTQLSLYRLTQHVLTFKKSSSGSNTCYKKHKEYTTAFSQNLDLNSMKKPLRIFLGVFEKLTKSDY